MIPAWRGAIEKRATPWAFVLTTLLRPLPVKRTATPLTGFRDCVTLAITSWRLPVAFTIPGVTLRTRHMGACAAGLGLGFATGFGFGVGAAVGGVAGDVTSVDASSVLFIPFVSLPSPVAVAELT